ncbi:hypothetical protein B0H12DRAFT_1236246 [Mycena haematopus]|nr:hypothetical protein B0H12DRAFT_1236246 [Mycena haematopus]
MGRNPFIPRKRSAIFLIALGVALFLAANVWFYPRSHVIEIRSLAPSFPVTDEVEPIIPPRTTYTDILTWVSDKLRQGSGFFAFFLALFVLGFFAWFVWSRRLVAGAPAEVLFEVDSEEGTVLPKEEALVEKGFEPKEKV